MVIEFVNELENQNTSLLPEYKCNGLTKKKIKVCIDI